MFRNGMPPKKHTLNHLLLTGMSFKFPHRPRFLISSILFRSYQMDGMGSIGQFIGGRCGPRTLARQLNKLFATVRKQHSQDSAAMAMQQRFERATHGNQIYVFAN